MAALYRKPTFFLRTGLLLVLACFLVIMAPQLARVQPVSETPSPEIVEILIQQLEQSSDWAERSAAARTLGESGLTSQDVTTALIQALEDPEPVVQLRATFALAEIGQPAVAPLISALARESPEVQANASFALKEIGPSTLPSLNSALGSSNARVVANSLAIIDQMAGDVESRADELSRTEISSAITSFETTLNHIQRSDSATGLENLASPLINESSNRSSLTETAQNLQQTIRELRSELQARWLQSLVRLLLIALGVPLISGLLLFWFKPELMLKLSNRIIQLRQNRTLLNQTLRHAEQFFQMAGATVHPLGIQSLKLSHLPGKLATFSPLPVTLLLQQPLEDDVADLAKRAKQLTKIEASQVAILIYKENPNALFRMRIAEVRIRDRFIVIPIPLAAIDQALLEPEGPVSLLAEYADRYLPGADLFDDRNAIGDTLSFFGRSELLQQLETDLTRSQGVGLFGLRKSGKTSLLLQLGFAMRQHPFIHIDLQPYGGKEYYCADLFNVILFRLHQLIKKEYPRTVIPPLLDNNISSTELADRFIDQVTLLLDKLVSLRYKTPMVCSLDEVERILPMGSDPKTKAEEFNTFFGALRTLSQDRRILSLLVADVHPDCNRISQWPQKDVPTNPVFGFFKECFVQPFKPQETIEMIADISSLMGIEFKGAIMETIHHHSGGHPFIARQLASLLYKKCVVSNNNQVDWDSAQKYLSRPFTYSGILKDYCGNNIWKDLEKRGFDAAISIFRLMACSQEDGPHFSETQLLQALKDEFTESQCLDALLWLESVGLLYRDESHAIDTLEIQVPLLAQWVIMQMREEEVQQWQLT